MVPRRRRRPRARPRSVTSCERCAGRGRWPGPATRSRRRAQALQAVAPEQPAPGRRAAVGGGVAAEVTQVEARARGRCGGSASKCSSPLDGTEVRWRTGERQLPVRWLLARDPPVDLPGHGLPDAGGLDAPELEAVPVLGHVGEHGDERPAHGPGVEVGRVAALVAERRVDLDQGVGDGGEEPGPDLAEALVALAGGQVDDPEDRAVLVPEVEEPVDRGRRPARSRSGPATARPGRCRGGRRRRGPSPRRARGWPPRRRRSTGRRWPATCPPPGRCR